jgi:hypothetical protein
MMSKKFALSSRIPVQDKEAAMDVDLDENANANANANDADADLFPENFAWNDNYDGYESAEDGQTKKASRTIPIPQDIIMDDISDQIMADAAPCEDNDDLAKDNMAPERESIPLLPDFSNMTKAEHRLHVQFNKMRTVC